MMRRIDTCPSRRRPTASSPAASRRPRPCRHRAPSRATGRYCSTLLRNFSGTSSEPESSSCPSAPSTLRRRSYSTPLGAVGHLRLQPRQLFDVLVDAVVAQLAEVPQHRVDLLRVDLLALEHAPQLLGLARPALDLAAELPRVFRIHAAAAIARATARERRLAERQALPVSPAGRVPVRIGSALTLLSLLTLLPCWPC